MLLVGGNKTESHAESAWLNSSKESFYEHLDFGFANVSPSTFRGPRQGAGAGFGPRPLLKIHLPTNNFQVACRC